MEYVYRGWEYQETGEIWIIRAKSASAGRKYFRKVIPKEDRHNWVEIPREEARRLCNI